MMVTEAEDKATEAPFKIRSAPMLWLGTLVIVAESVTAPSTMRMSLGSGATRAGDQLSPVVNADGPAALQK
jgi:hypothetical protein